MRLAACGVLIVLANRCNTTVAVEMAANSRSVLDRLDSDRLDFGTLTLDLGWLVVQTAAAAFENRDARENVSMKQFSILFYLFTSSPKCLPKCKINNSSPCLDAKICRLWHSKHQFNVKNGKKAFCT